MANCEHRLQNNAYIVAMTGTEMNEAQICIGNSLSAVPPTPPDMRVRIRIRRFGEEEQGRPKDN